MNATWIDRPDWELTETITHELVHLYQEEILKNSSKQPYRNAILVGTMNELGWSAWGLIDLHTPRQPQELI